MLAYEEDLRISNVVYFVFSDIGRCGECSIRLSSNLTTLEV